VQLWLIIIKFCGLSGVHIQGMFRSECLLPEGDIQEKNFMSTDGQYFLAVGLHKERCRHSRKKTPATLSLMPAYKKLLT